MAAVASVREADSTTLAAAWSYPSTDDVALLGEGFPLVTLGKAPPAAAVILPITCFTAAINLIAIASAYSLACGSDGRVVRVGSFGAM